MRESERVNICVCVCVQFTWNVCMIEAIDGVDVVNGDRSGIEEEKVEVNYVDKVRYNEKSEKEREKKR